MNSKNQSDLDDDMRPEYNFDPSEGVRGKYYKRLMEEGSNIIKLDSDVYEVFRDSVTVNTALRSLIEISQKAGKSKDKRKSRGSAVPAHVPKA